MTHISNAHFNGVCPCLIRLPFASYVFATSLYAVYAFQYIYTVRVHYAMILLSFVLLLHMHMHMHTRKHMQPCKSRLREGFALLKGKLNFYKFFFRVIFCAVCLNVVVSLLCYCLVFHVVAEFYDEFLKCR